MIRLGGTPTPEMKARSERTYKRNMQLKRRNTSRNGGEQISAEQDDKYERLRRVVGYCLAHKAWWHNKGAITIYASADFPSSSDV